MMEGIVVGNGGLIGNCGEGLGLREGKEEEDGFVERR
jgi:hypothetical protein